MLMFKLAMSTSRSTTINSNGSLLAWLLLQVHKLWQVLGVDFSHEADRLKTWLEVDNPVNNHVNMTQKVPELLTFLTKMLASHQPEPNM